MDSIKIPITAMVYLLAMPLPAARGRETRLFVNNEYVTELCMRNVLPSLFLAKDVIESDSKALYFSKKPLPYSCQTSIGTEIGSHLIVVMIPKEGSKSSCQRYPEQMVVYSLDESVKRYWAKLPPGVTHPPPENQQNYSSTTVSQESTTIFTYTSPKPVVQNRHYIVEEIPIVNMTLNLEEEIFDDEFYDDDKKGESKTYLEPTDIPIVNVSLIDSNKKSYDTTTDVHTLPKAEDEAGATSEATSRNDQSSLAPSAETHTEDDEQSQSDVVSHGHMTYNNNWNEEHHHHNHRKHGQISSENFTKTSDIRASSGVQNTIELIFPNSTDSLSISIPSSTLNAELKNDSQKETTSSNFLLLRNHSETHYKVTPLNTKWWDWRTFTRVTKNKILFDKDVSNDKFRKTTPITRSQFNNSQNAVESGLSRLPQKVPVNDSLIEISDDDSGEHLARIYWEEGTSVFNQTVVDHEDTVTQYTTRDRDATPAPEWNLVQQNDMKSRIFDQMHIGSGIHKRNVREGKKRSPEYDVEDKKSKLIRGVVSEENLANFLIEPVLNICDRGKEEDVPRYFVGVANSSRVLLRLVNFSMDGILVIITTGRILNLQSDSCEHQQVECQAAGTRVCVGADVRCDGVPNCGSFNSYDEDKVACKKANSEGGPSPYLSALMFLFAFSVLLYMLNYWLRRCVPKVSGAFFVYKDDGDNVLYLDTIMKSPHDAINLTDLRQSTNTVQSLTMLRTRSIEIEGQTEREAPNTLMSLLLKIFCFWKKNRILHGNKLEDRSTELQKTTYSYTEMELKRFLPSSVDTGIQTGSSIQMKTEMKAMKSEDICTECVDSNPQEHAYNTELEPTISERFSQMLSSLDLVESSGDTVLMRVVSEMSSMGSFLEEDNRIVLHTISGLEKEIRTIDFSSVLESANKESFGQRTDNDEKNKDKEVSIIGELDKKRLRFNEDMDNNKGHEKRLFDDNRLEIIDQVGADEVGVASRGEKEKSKGKKSVKSSRTKSKRLT